MISKQASYSLLAISLLANTFLSRAIYISECIHFHTVSPWESNSQPWRAMLYQLSYTQIALVIHSTLHQKLQQQQTKNILAKFYKPTAKQF